MQFVATMAVSRGNKASLENSICALQPSTGEILMKNVDREKLKP